MSKKIVDEIKEVVKSRKKKKLATGEQFPEYATFESLKHASLLLQEKMTKLELRIDSIVDAIDRSRKVKGL